MCIEGTNFDMQLDTAADVSLLPENLYRKHLSHLPLKPAGIVLKTYENQTVELVGKILVTVKYEDQQVTKSTVDSNERERQSSTIWSTVVGTH